MLCRMYSCVTALIFGEDFSSDPVSRGLGLIVHLFSGGQVQINTAIVAQVSLSLVHRHTTRQLFYFVCWHYVMIHGMAPLNGMCHVAQLGTVSILRQDLLWPGIFLRPLC